MRGRGGSNLGLPRARRCPPQVREALQLFADGVALLESDDDPGVLAACRDPVPMEQTEVSDVETVQDPPVAGSAAQMVFVISTDHPQSEAVRTPMRRAQSDSAHREGRASESRPTFSANASSSARSVSISSGLA
jgi:hypothetical protein